MAPRLKKLIGVSILLPGLALYVFAAAALGERVPDVTLLQALYYLTAGIAWAFPARYLMRWVEAEPKESNPPS